MIVSVLHTLGLSTVEQQLYEALVALPSATDADIDAIAEDAGWDQYATSAALTRLLDLHLADRTTDGSDLYTATSPYTALDTMLGARAQELLETRERVLRLNARYYDRSDRQPTDPLVEVVSGRDAVLRWLADFYDTVRSELAGYDTPPYLDTVSNGGNMMRLDDHRSQVEYRILYSTDGLGVAGRIHIYSTQEDEPRKQYRVGDVPMKMYLADRRIAMMPLDQRRVYDALLVIRDPALLRLLYLQFDEYWNRALPLRSYGNSLGPQAVALTTSNRELLALLASGHNDQAIADQLGLAPRTVSRRVAGLMRDLGVTTRFHAGYQAVVRGWIGPLTDPDDTSSQTPVTQL